MVASPLHASTVGLIRNLRTNHISPQFHVIYDGMFETVHSGEEVQRASWPDLIIFNRFKSDYNDNDFVPELADEWLTPVELSHRQQREQARQNGDEPLLPEHSDSQRVTGVSHNLDETASQRVPYEHSTPQRETTQAKIEPKEPLEGPPSVDALQDESEVASITSVRQNPQRNCRTPERYHQHGYLVVRYCCRAMTAALSLTRGHAYDNQYLLNLLLDHEFGCTRTCQPMH
jgi:hypothetical protein